MRAVLLAAALAAGTLQAQVVEVRVRDQASGEPVVGAIVRLLGPAGPVSQALSSAVGLAVLRAPAPGTYRLRADRIGHRGIETPPFPLGAGETLRRDLPMPVDPVLLPALVVTGDAQCGTDLQRSALAGALWDEVQKALAATELTQQSGRLPLRVTLFERELNPRGVQVAERPRGSMVISGQPFVTLPAASLERTGFVRFDDDSLEYAAPDAVLLQSDAFVRTHCFRGVPAASAPDGLVGLAFEPVPGRRLPEIAGTLWLDRASHELRRIEYRYLAIPGVPPQLNAGGQVVFRRLSDGTWIVSDWHIVMPQIVPRTIGLRGQRETVREFTGYLVRGGRAVPATDLAARPPTSAILRGVVHDSLSGSGLVGARVHVAGLEESTVTDAAGAFRLEVPLVGERLVTIRHPRLALVADRSTQPVNLRSGQESVLEASVPPVARFVQVFCGRGAGEAGVLGLAWLDDQPAQGIEIRARGLAARRTTTSGPRGVFSICDLPPERPVTLELVRDGAVVAQRDLRLRNGEFLWLDLRAGPPPPQGVRPERRR